MTEAGWDQLLSATPVINDIRTNWDQTSVLIASALAAIAVGSGHG